LFFWTFCFAGGLALGLRHVARRTFVDWYEAAAAAATIAIAVGLVRQARVVRQSVRSRGPLQPSFAFSANLAYTWRMAAAIFLAILMALQYSLNRQLLILPEKSDIYGGDILQSYTLWLLQFIALGDALSRAAARASRSGRHLWTTLGGLALLFFGAYVVIDKSFIVYLTHRGMRNIDAAQTFTGDRYPQWMPADQIWLTVTSCAAVAAIIIAGALFIRVFSSSIHLISTASAIIIGLCLTSFAVAFDGWFYRMAFPAISPDYRGVGIGSNWSERLGGGILVGLVAVVGAVRIARKAAAKREVQKAEPIDLPLAGESLPVLALLSASSVYFVVRTIREFTNVAVPLGWKKTLLELVAYPDTTFVAALAICSIRLGYLRLKGLAPAPLVLVPLSPWRFLAALLLLLALAAAAIPTLAAFSFSFWLSGWSGW
jgi:hypothetical protein